MSEDGLDGLFGGSDDGAPAPPRPASIASSSRGSPKPSGTATPAKDEEAIDDLVCPSEYQSVNQELTTSLGMTTTRPLRLLELLHPEELGQIPPPTHLPLHGLGRQIH